MCPCTNDVQEGINDGALRFVSQIAAMDGI